MADSVHATTVKTLFVDLASHQGCLACVEDDRVVASFPVDHRIDDAELMTHVEDLLSRAKWSYPDLTNIACVVGPGGFTSLRVAVALANAMSHELGVPSVGVHLSDLYGTRIADYVLRNENSEIRNSKSETIWLHSTKKNELFIREVSAPEARCITIDELKTTLKRGMWMGELIPEHRTIVDAAGVTEAPLRPAEDILPAFLQQQMYKRQILQPWYGRGW